MVLVQRIRKRGANIVVEANGEVLFAATGDVGRWTNRFSQRVRAFASADAPVNKRPRWGHYGKPLKSTMVASTTYQPIRMRVYAAVGSTSAHSAYVDQGTGVHVGHSAYPAKILPPWTRGGPSLYEHTWKPAGPGGKTVAPVMIRGQKGQFFFASGLKRGFQSMRMRSFQVPGDAQISGAMSSFPDSLANFVGNTPADAAFVASLTEWRAWRDEAWAAREELGRNHSRGVKRKDAVKARRNLAASRAASQARKQAVLKAAAEAKAAREKARKAREEREHWTALTKEKSLARIRAQKYANRDYTGVSLRTVYNAAHTQVIGFDLLYTDTSGVSHVDRFRV